MRAGTGPGFVRLSFLVPSDFAIDASLAAANPPPSSPYGCVVSAIFGTSLPLIEIKGPSREAVFERAALYLHALKRTTSRPVAIAATLETPPDDRLRRGFRDSWTIIIGAEIAFSPTGIDPHFPRALPARPPPELVVLHGRSDQD